MANEEAEMMDQAAFHDEQLKLQQDIEEALKHAEQGKATQDEIRLLAWASGVKYQPKEKQHEMV